MKPMSPRQTQVFAYMVEFFSANDQLPPHTVVSQFLGTAPNHSYELSIALEKKGYIERNAVGKFRFTEPGRQLALDQMKNCSNARWPFVGANPQGCGDRPAGKGMSTRDTTKPCQQDTGLKLSATVSPCRPAPVNGPLSTVDYSGSSAWAR
jgi:hypothetical protein